MLRGIRNEIARLADRYLKSTIEFYGDCVRMNNFTDTEQYVFIAIIGGAISHDYKVIKEGNLIKIILKKRAITSKKMPNNYTRSISCDKMHYGTFINCEGR